MANTKMLFNYMDIIFIPSTFYKTIGLDLFAYRSTDKWRNMLFNIFYFMSILNFSLALFGLFVHMYLSMQQMDTILSACAVVPFIGFSVVAVFKQLAMALYRQTLNSHFDIMESIFPSTLAEQADSNVNHHATHMKRIIKLFCFTCFSCTGVFSFYPILKSIFRYLFGIVSHYERILCFLIWYPFNATENTFIFVLVLISQLWSAHVGGILFAATDLLLVTSVTQLSMHFYTIERKLAHYEWQPDDELANMRFLWNIVQYHSKCLEQSAVLNQIFGFSLLVNFFTTSLMICFIGFYATNSTMEDIVLYIFFLLASMSQMFLVCYNGDVLMTASSRVGDGAYNQSWFDASNHYKRMLVFIMQRSQQMTAIQPPTLPPISFNTYMKVISMSYQFFTLLQTTYGD